jgi:hypothetical protein
MHVTQNVYKKQCNAAKHSCASYTCTSNSSCSMQDTMILLLYQNEYCCCSITSSARGPCISSCLVSDIVIAATSRGILTAFLPLRYRKIIRKTCYNQCLRTQTAITTTLNVRTEVCLDRTKLHMVDTAQHPIYWRTCSYYMVST